MSDGQSEAVNLPYAELFLETFFSHLDSFTWRV